MQSENMLQPRKLCSQDEIPVFFDHMLYSGDEFGMMKYITLGELIASAESSQLLESMFSTVRSRGLLLQTNHLDSLNEYTDIVSVRTTARMFSLHFEYEFFQQFAVSMMKLFRSTQSNAKNFFSLPDLKISVDGFNIHHNLDEVAAQMRNLLALYAKDYVVGKPRDEQKQHFDRLIQDLNDLNLLSGNNRFGDIVKHLKTARKNLPKVTEPPLKDDTLRHIFLKDGHKLFVYLTEENWTPQDISFYFRRMVEDGYICATQIVFLRWFNDEFNANISQVKTLGNIANKPGRERNYTQAKQLYNK